MQKKKQFIMRFIKIIAPFLSVFLLSLVFSTQVKADDDDPFDVTNPWGFTNPMSPNNPNSPTNPINWDDDEKSNDTSTEDNVNNELPSETHAREKREEKQNQKEQDEAMNSPINLFAFFSLIVICLIILTWIFI